jgi:YihY family inner membrane protein
MSNPSTADLDTHGEEPRGRRLLKRIDVWQQKHRGPSFLVAVLLRYREDRGRDYGALLSYFGFISLFPLLLVLVTVLGIVLEGHVELRDQILDSVYSKIPLLGAQLRQSQTVLNSSGWVLAVGLFAATWSGLAVIRRTQDAFNLQWGVPPFRRPGFITVQLRALGALAVVGVGITVTTAATSLAALLPELPWEGRLFGGLLAICLNIAVLTVAFRLLTEASVPWRQFYVGGAVGGVALWALQLIGATYVGHVVKGASEVYGAFAVVFGLLVWIALLARVTLLASEINVVLTKRFWPRSLSRGMVTGGDHRAIRETARRAALVTHQEAADFEGGTV